MLASSNIKVYMKEVSQRGDQVLHFSPEPSNRCKKSFYLDKYNLLSTSNEDRNLLLK